MSISILKGVDKAGATVASFDRPIDEVVAKIVEMVGVASDAQLASSVLDIDVSVPMERIAELDVVPVEDDGLYKICIDESDTEKATEPVGKPDVGRQPSEPAGAAVVQSLIFDKERFSVEEAKAWIRDHEGFGDYGVEETETSYRFRQYDPQHFSRFRTGQITTGIQAVFGVVKGPEMETEEDAEKSIDATEKALVGYVSVHAFNKALDDRGLTLLHDSARVTKADDGAEERFVMSLVLEPNDGQNGAPLKPDTQKDIYSAETVRKAAHGWMEHYGHIDLMHNWRAMGKEDVAVLESYLAPCDFELGGYNVIKGTWMLALRVKNDELWQAIKSGKIGAYSVGGTAVRKPVEGDPSDGTE